MPPRLHLLRGALSGSRGSNPSELPWQSSVAPCHLTRMERMPGLEPGETTLGRRARTLAHPQRAAHKKILEHRANAAVDGSSPSPLASHRSRSRESNAPGAHTRGPWSHDRIGKIGARTPPRRTVVTALEPLAGVGPAPASLPRRTPTVGQGHGDNRLGLAPCIWPAQLRPALICTRCAFATTHLVSRSD